MKILFFSDIHGIKDNLIYIEQLINNHNFDKIVVLGDLYYGGPTYNSKFEINSIYVKDFLTNYSSKIIALRGNCDSDVDIKSSDFPIIEDLALINTDNIDIYCTHGHKYSYTKNSKINRKCVLVYGHEHMPYIKKEGEIVYICVGSISLPRNSSYSYMIYNDHTFTLYDLSNNVIDSIEL